MLAERETDPPLFKAFSRGFAWLGLVRVIRSHARLLPVSSTYLVVLFNSIPFDRVVVSNICV